MQQSFQLWLEFDEDTKVGDLRDLADDLRTRLILLGNRGLPRIARQLLEAERDPLPLLIDRNHLAGDRIALLEQLVRVRDFAGPRHVADVQQPIDTLFEFDERTVVGEVANRAADRRTGWVLGGDLVPRIRLRLLHAERDFLLVLVDAEHNHIDLITGIDEFGRMIDALGPRHLADMNQSLNAVFQLHEGTVRHHIDHFATNLRADRVLGLDVVPRAGVLLLQAERDLFLVAIDVQDHHLEFLVDLDHLGRMADATPAHVGDVQQAVDAAQVHERTEVGDVLDDALAKLAFDQFRQQGLLHLFALDFDEPSARDHDVAASLVDFQDQALDRLTAVRVDVLGTSNIDLAGGQEHVHADVDQQTALDLLENLALDDVPFLVGADDLFPLANAVGLPLGEQDQSELIFDFFEQDRDLLTRDRWFVGVGPFVERDDPFALVANVDQNFFAFDPHDRPFEYRVDIVAGVPQVVLGDQCLFGGFGVGQRQPQRGFEFRITNIEFPQQIPIDHTEKIPSW